MLVSKRNEQGLSQVLINGVRGSFNPVVAWCQQIFNFSGTLDGNVVDVLRETKHGFTVGRVMLDGIEDSSGQCEVTFRNEFLIAKHDGRVVATVPDLICCLDREIAEPLATESLKYGNRVKVVGIAAAPVMRTPEALNIFGPRAFEMEEDSTPLEELG